MEINISKYAGFCNGVQRAYEIVQKLANDSQVKKPIYVLGSLVHNDDVVRSIEKWGIKKIDFSGKISEAKKEINKYQIGTLVITAHGIGPEIFEVAEKKDIDIVDTTCPKVIKAQRLAEVAWKRERRIIIIGKKRHKETMGILRWARKDAVVVETEYDVLKIYELVSPEDKVTIVSQTTQNKDQVDKLIEKLLLKFPFAEILDTVCETTKNRQEEAKNLAKQNDVMLVVGSPDSSNSTELWNISKTVNPCSYFIERAEQIDFKWFNDCQSVGLTAGASTPDWITKKIVEMVEKI